MAESKKKAKKSEAFSVINPATVELTVGGAEISGIIDLPPPDSLIPEVLGFTNDYTLTAFMDRQRTLVKVEVINQKDNSVHSFDTVSQANQFIYKAGLR